MKIDYSNPQSIQMFNRTCIRGWYHHKRKIRKKNYARAQRLLRIWMDLGKEKVRVKRAHRIMHNK